MTTYREIRYKKGYKYQLAENAVDQTKIRPKADITTKFIELTTDGKLTVLNGYAWNGPSGPTIDTRSAMMPSLFHDAKYQLIRLGLLSMECRSIADDEFYDDCIFSRMNKIRAAIWVECVEQFGESSALPSAEPKVLVAP